MRQGQYIKTHATQPRAKAKLELLKEKNNWLAAKTKDAEDRASYESSVSTNKIYGGRQS